MQAIEAQLTDVFRKTFDKPDLEIRPEMTAADVDGWDSLTHVELISAVEKTFGLKFKLKEITKLQNVGDLIALVNKHLGA